MGVTVRDQLERETIVTYVSCRHEVTSLSLPVALADRMFAILPEVI